MWILAYRRHFSLLKFGQKHTANLNSVRIYFYNGIFIAVTSAR